MPSATPDTIDALAPITKASEDSRTYAVNFTELLDDDTLLETPGACEIEAKFNTVTSAPVEIDEDDDDELELGEIEVADDDFPDDGDPPVTIDAGKALLVPMSKGLRGHTYVLRFPVTLDNDEITCGRCRVIVE